MSEATLLVEKRKTGEISRYSGVCNNCNSPVTTDEKITVIEIYECENFYLLIPVDKLTCPFCLRIIGKVVIYKAKSLDVTVALSEMNRG